MKHKTICFAFFLGSIAGVADAQFVNGVSNQDTSGQTVFVPTGGPPGSINFDSGVAPCGFNDTTALTDEYSALGVVFSGPGGNDGGAVLNQCGNFSVSGFSPPNFLAFNANSSLGDGGAPIGPETLSFDAPIVNVTIKAGHPNAGTIGLECFDGSSNSLGSDSLVATQTLETLAVFAENIESCELRFTGTVAVFDDLTYGPPPSVRPIPTVSQWGTLLLALSLAAVAIYRLQSRRSAWA